MLGALIFASALSAASAAQPFEIPFELDHGHIFVSAYVNGAGPERFGFDTGASGIGRVDAQLTARLALPKAGEGETSDSVTTATADLVSVGSLRLGGIEKRDVKLLSRDYNGGKKADPIMGIIARDFFAGWTVAIDYPAKTIRFDHRALRAGEPGVVAYGGSFAIPVCFAAGCFPAKIDTGSSRGIVLPKDIVAKLSLGTPVKLGEAKRTNGSVTLYETDLREPIEIAGIRVTGQKALYADPSGNFIVIGSDFLKNYILTIDQKQHLLSIRRP